MKQFVLSSSIIMTLAIIAGAFGAHSLKPKISAYQLDIFNTGVEFMIYHGLAILALAILTRYLPVEKLKVVWYLFMGGIVLFSGSLLLLACREILNIKSWTWLGPLTPAGGLCFILGWVTLAIVAWKSK